MAGRKVMEKDIPTASTSLGAGDAAGKKGPRKILVPTKKKNFGNKKEPTVGNANAPSKKTARFRKDSANTPKKRNVTNNDGSQSDSSDEEPEEVDCEDLYKVIYVEDFCDTVNLVPDDTARHISLLMDMDADRMHLLEIVEKEMTKLLDELDACGVTGASAVVKNNVKNLLIQISMIDDQRVRTTDEIADIFEEKLRMLRIDLSNLNAEVAKHDPDTPTIPKSSKNLKKPSINPTHNRNIRGTPSKLNLVGTNGDHNKLPYPISASATSTANPPNSPARSYCSTSSFDTKSGKDSQPSVQDNLEDDSRYRACKFKNPPLYVFNGRFPTSNSSTPNKTEVLPKSQRKEADKDREDEADGRKVNDRKEKLRQKTLSASQGSKGSKGGSDSGEDTSSSDSSDSDSDVSSPEPTYCLCEKISHGKMVQCDNELCPIEWFHFRCVSLKKIPKGEWFCPKCRGENSSVMKPKQQFLKELEQYNKAKERESLKELQRKERN